MNCWGVRQRKQEEGREQINEAEKGEDVYVL